MERARPTNRMAPPATPTPMPALSPVVRPVLLLLLLLLVVEEGVGVVVVVAEAEVVAEDEVEETPRETGMFGQSLRSSRRCCCGRSTIS
jgi:hypothetical protein